MKWLLLILSFNAYALEVIKPQFSNIIEMKIVRVEADSFSTYLLMTESLTELTLVCAKNLAYDKNRYAFIEFRNYYRELAGNFVIESNQACLDLGQFIESSQSGVTIDTPFIITLNRKKMVLERIIYPKLDPFAQAQANKVHIKAHNGPIIHY